MYKLERDLTAIFEEFFKKLKTNTTEEEYKRVLTSFAEVLRENRDNISLASETVITQIYLRAVII